MQPGEALPTLNTRNEFGLALLRNYFPEYRLSPSGGEPQTVISKPLGPIVEEFKHFIENNGEVFAGFNTMFDQAPKPKDGDLRKIENYLDLLDAFDTLLGAPPVYAEDGLAAMVAGVPFYGILARFCNTPAGYNIFTHPGVNERFHRMFSQYHDFLGSPASRTVLNTGDNGWLSDKAQASAVEHAGGPPDAEKFPDYYVCDTEDPHYGYESYDAYFVRELKASKRAVICPDDPTIINSPCSAEFHMTHSPLKELEKFWVKKTPYSLRQMLGNHQFTSDFVGGYLIQAMLASRDYHRWRSPIEGIVEDTQLIPGTYYASRLLIPPSADPDPSTPSTPTDDPDPVSRSMDFVSQISTRALIFIRSKEIGLVCFVGVGLGEISTCKIVVEKGQRLAKGDELGHFHFGGSTFCLLFGPHIEVTPLFDTTKKIKFRVGQDMLKVALRPGINRN
ncbi:phosphatidylserine decarboxylase-domain-containing protein [Scleroderma yunnanense]